MNEHLRVLELLKEEYINTSIDFNGNEDIQPFSAKIIDFDFDSDNSIFVILKDTNNSQFTINWDTIRHCKFYMN